MIKNFFIFLFFFIFINCNSFATTKENVISNLKLITNVSFNFEQNINGKTQKGNCTIEYPKKIFCKYDLNNKKILVSNGKSLVIKTTNSYNIYPLDKTPLNIILNKKFLIEKIKLLKERIVDDKFINFYFFDEEIQNEINIFFDINNFNLIGWQTLDIYQNLSITYLSSIIKNQKIKKNLFILPSQN